MDITIHHGLTILEPFDKDSVEKFSSRVVSRQKPPPFSIPYQQPLRGSQSSRPKKIKLAEPSERHLKNSLNDSWKNITSMLMIRFRFPVATLKWSPLPVSIKETIIFSIRKRPTTKHHSQKRYGCE